MGGWLNEKIPAMEDKLKLVSSQLVLCHLNLAPWNLLWAQDGSVTLVDWLSAGFYPRSLETFLLKITEKNLDHGDYETRLLEQVGPLSVHEERQVGNLLRFGIVTGRHLYVVYLKYRENTAHIQEPFDLIGSVQTIRSRNDPFPLFWHATLTKTQAVAVRAHPQVCYFSVAVQMLIVSFHR